MKTVSTEDCWLWAGSFYGSGHGQQYLGWKNGKQISAPAHVVVYEALVGQVPDGLELDHLCEVPPCVNPAHLEPVTHQENTLRHYRNRTHCRKGHEYTPENIIWKSKATNKSLSRYCRECNNSNVREYKRRKRSVLV